MTVFFSSGICSHEFHIFNSVFKMACDYECNEKCKFSWSTWQLCKKVMFGGELRKFKNYDKQILSRDHMG